MADTHENRIGLINKAIGDCSDPRAAYVTSDQLTRDPGAVIVMLAEALAFESDRFGKQKRRAEALVEQINGVRAECKRDLAKAKAPRVATPDERAKLVSVQSAVGDMVDDCLSEARVIASPFDALLHLAGLIDYHRRRADDAEALNESAQATAEQFRAQAQTQATSCAATPSPATAGEAETIGREIGALVDEKDRAYGRAFDKVGAFLRLLYPDGIKPEHYADAMALVRIFDKLVRIATDRDALGESPFGDIAGYALLALRRRRNEAKVATVKIGAEPQKAATFLIPDGKGNTYVPFWAPPVDYVHNVFNHTVPERKK